MSTCKRIGIAKEIDLFELIQVVSIHGMKRGKFSLSFAAIACSTTLEDSSWLFGNAGSLMSRPVAPTSRIKCISRIVNVVFVYPKKVTSVVQYGLMCIVRVYKNRRDITENRIDSSRVDVYCSGL